MYSMAFRASPFFFVFCVTLYLRESFSFVSATNLTRIELNYSEDEGVLFSALEVPDNGVGFCLRSRLLHCRGQKCSHLT